LAIANTNTYVKIDETAIKAIAEAIRQTALPALEGIPNNLPLQQQNIDILVEQVRSFGYPKIKEFGVVRMLRGPKRVVPVNDIYIDLNVLKQPSAALYTPTTDNQETQPALKVIYRHRQLILLGQAWIGKNYFASMASRTVY